jgi:hypothetical protein
MPQIPERFSFQPTKDALSKWLATRKPEISVANTSIPGFFSDFKYEEDSKWFWALGIMGELIGIILIVIGAAKKGGFYLTIAVVLSIVLVICDIILARKLHRNMAKKCYIRSELYLVGTSDPQYAQKLKVEAEEGTSIDWLFRAFIVIIAIVKLLSVMGLGVSRILWVYIPIAVLYAFVCYVHLSHTGYYLAYNSVDGDFKRQYKDFGNGKNNAIELSLPFKSEFKLKDTPIKVGKNEIVEDIPPQTTDNNGKTQYHYVLRTTGVLEDNDISLLMNGQESNQKQVIAYQCRKHQLENMSNALVKRQTN